MENENEQQQPILDEYHRQIDALIKQTTDTSERILRYAKLRIDANERLMFLASGVLTLTFSGAVSLYSRSDHHLTPPELRPLLWAWKLLITAIVLCIIANSREGLAASILDNELLASEVWARGVLLKVLGEKLKPSPPKITAPPPTQGKSGGTHERIARLCGWSARVMTVAAFVCLYWFVRMLVLKP